jgi:pyrimidine deaminase RibD-like protein
LVEIGADQIEIDGDRYAVGEFDWAKPTSPAGDQLLVALTEVASIEPGRYYLPPPFRKGDKHVYPLSRKRPLYPVRCEPDLRQWKSALESAETLRKDELPAFAIERAIELAAMCKPEPSDRPRPRVGAVVVRGQRIIGEGYRNKDGRGSHAEEIALADVESRLEGRDDARRTASDLLTGATIVTTLEPCTTGRSAAHAECTWLLLRSGIGRVVIGMLDPNPDIQGNGWKYLMMNGVETRMFPPSLARRVWEQNEAFLESWSEGDTAVRVPWRLPPLETAEGS